MAKGRGGLGRGLESLFEDAAPSFASDTRIETLPLREIEPDPEQPRKTFEEEPLAELAASISEHGLLQPIAVRPQARGGYLIVAGERRWRACRMAGLTEGKSRSALANSLRLLNLPETVLELLKSGFLTTGHAKVILGLPTPELQEQAAQIIADHQLNVRQAEVLCKKLTKPEQPPKEPPLRSTLPVEVEESLKQALGGEVNVAYHDGKGKLTVHFYSDEQLKAFANLLGQYQTEE